MYDDLTLRLREAAKMSEALAVLLPHSEGNATAKLYNEAADAIEELEASVEGFEAQTNMVLNRDGNNTVIRFEPKWIPVTERLPKYGDWVLGIGPKKGYHVCEYRGISHFLYSGDSPWFSAKGRAITVTHWMPLPEPPKEG